MDFPVGVNVTNAHDKMASCKYSNIVKKLGSFVVMYEICSSTKHLGVNVFVCECDAGDKTLGKNMHTHPSFNKQLNTRVPQWSVSR